MKKPVSIILSAIMLLSLPAAANLTAAAAVTENEAVGAVTSGTTGDCSWSFDSATGAMTITGTGEGKMKYYADETQIPWYGFRSKIKTLTLGRGVTTVSQDIFRQCTELTTVKFSGSVSIIDSGAFEYCSKLATANFNPPLKTIGASAFYGTALTEVKLPLSVKEVKSRAFSRCDKLQSVTVPDGCAARLDSCFTDCRALTAVSLGNMVSDINEAFSECPVTSMSVSENNRTFAVSGSCLCSKDLTKLYYYFGGDTHTAFTVPATVTEIGSRAFYGHDYLTSVSLPARLTTVGEAAFNCVRIADFSFPDTLQSVGEDAFAGTVWLENQADGLVYAGKVAYLYKGAVPQTVTLKSDTVGIAGGAFRNAASLKTVTLSSSLTNIGERAFSGCKKLSTARITRKVNTIGAYAFGGCTSLTALTLPASVTQLGNGCFAGCTSLKKLTLSANLSAVPDSCFAGCTSLAGDIVIPKTVTAVEAGAFRDTDGVGSFTVLNPSTAFDDILRDALGFGQNVRRIYGFAGSTAETYAGTNSWLFTAITEIRGDANFDGRVDVRDITAIQRAVAEVEPLSPQAIANADMTHNSAADISDASVIQRYLAEYTADLG